MTMMRIYNIREAASRNALLTYPPFTVSPSECLCTLAAGSFGGGRARAALESKFSRFSHPDEAHFPSEKLTALRHIVLYRTHLEAKGGASDTLYTTPVTPEGRPLHCTRALSPHPVGCQFGGAHIVSRNLCLIAAPYGATDFVHTVCSVDAAWRHGCMGRLLHAQHCLNNT